ncbi:hypothetical protein [Nostoc sp. KVJ3]|nr:hypothetical protein [Nostoc sp. KVJ3]
MVSPGVVSCWSVVSGYLQKTKDKGRMTDVGIGSDGNGIKLS